MGYHPVVPMECIPRHQCLFYEGAPLRHLPALARVIRTKLDENYRCLYLNSSPMVLWMRSYLDTEGVDVERQVRMGNLVFESDQRHLVNGRFDIDRMLQLLQDALQQALSDGRAGLWATGDMSWEMGPDKNLAKLLEYERRLEEFLSDHPEMGGICQYRSDVLPPEAVREGFVAHRSIFINETLSMVNPHFLHPGSPATEGLQAAEVPLAIHRLQQAVLAS